MPDKKKLGFAAMDEDQRKAFARMGGRASAESGNGHQFTKEEAKEAGQKGGAVTSKDREHMAKIGQRGGMKISADREHMAAIGRKGGEAVSGDRDHMAEIGRKGGEGHAEAETKA